MRIAIIEDNPSVAKGIAYRLQDRGHAVDVLDDGEAADAFLRDDSNDVLIVDVNLPGLSGIELVRRMRARSDDRPVLMLTAREALEDRVSGLDAGADDYLVKPFEMDELEARLRALSRRRNRSIEQTFAFGPLEFDTDARRATLAGSPLDLPRRELALLEALLAAKGRTLSKSHLIEHLYGTGAEVEESAIEVHMSRLRKRLRDSGVEIRAQRGLGYRLSLSDAAP